MESNFKVSLSFKFGIDKKTFTRFQEIVNYIFPKHYKPWI